MKKLIIIVAIICLMYGCKKNTPGTEEPPVLQTCRISSVIDVNAKDTFRITYNQMGKITAVTMKTTVLNFFHSGNTASIIKVINGLYSGRTIVTNNTEGLAINVKTEFDAAGSDWLNTLYEYQGEEIFRATRTFSSATTPNSIAYAWNNHNLVSITAGATVVRLEYDTDKPGQEGDYLFLQGLLSGYDLYRSKNLLKSIDGAVFTYERRQDGKITSIAIGPNTVYKYEYECN